MVVEFAPLLGGEEAVRFSIGKALNHKGFLKRVDPRKGLHDWLTDEVRFKQQRNGTAQGQAMTAEEEAKVMAEAKVKGGWST